MKNTLSIDQNYIFRAVYRHGRQASGKNMSIYVLKNRLKKANRLGLTVSTKLGCAVVRNRIRRRLREAYRLMEDELSLGYDVVIVAKSPAEDVPFPELQGDMRNILRRLGALER